MEAAPEVVGLWIQGGSEGVGRRSWTSDRVADKDTVVIGVVVRIQSEVLMYAAILVIEVNSYFITSGHSYGARDEGCYS